MSSVGLGPGKTVNPDTCHFSELVSIRSVSASFDGWRL
jgi:hypothetical protein